MNPTALLHRKRVAIRLLLLEAGFLAGILGAFALVSLWLSGTGSMEPIALQGGILMAALLVFDWYLIRSHWKRLGDESGGSGWAPQDSRRKH